MTTNIFQPYLNKYFQLKSKMLNINESNYKTVISSNFEFISFIALYNSIKREENLEGKENYLKDLKSIVQSSYYSKFDKEIPLDEMSRADGYSYDLSDEPLFKTSILY